MNPNRTPSKKEEWLDFKVFLYGYFTMAELSIVFVKLLKEFEKKFKYGTNTRHRALKLPNRKRCWAMFNVDAENKMITEEYVDIKITEVKKTIKLCVNTDIYWETKKNIFKNIIKLDFKDKTAMSEEVNEYNRSITSYVRKDKYNNLDFYFNNKYYSKTINSFNSQFNRNLTKEGMLEIMNLPGMWEFFQEVR